MIDRENPREFRQFVRQFIAEHAPAQKVREGLSAPRDGAEERALRQWYRDLFSAGLLGGGWPEEDGGSPDHRTFHDTIVMEEIILARAPRPLDQTFLAAHVLMSFGTPEQRQKYVPRIRSGEDVWCQLFSEPGVGSDLAALSTRARALPGDRGYQIDGQKVWTTDGQWAQMGFLLARTDPDAALHAGITAFVVPMDAPGVEVRPIREMTGASAFCEVFLDRLVLDSTHVLGQVDDGWTVVTSGLASERGYIGARVTQLDVMFDDLVGLARVLDVDGSPALEHEDVRQRIAALQAEIEAVRTSSLRATSDAADDVDGQIAKLTFTELNVRMCEEAVDLISSGGGDSPELNALRESWFHLLMWSRALTISGGSSEIVRSVVAQQLLGLPRSWSRAR